MTGGLAMGVVIVGALGSFLGPGDPQQAQHEGNKNDEIGQLCFHFPFTCLDFFWLIILIESRAQYLYQATLQTKSGTLKTIFPPTGNRQAQKWTEREGILSKFKTDGRPVSDSLSDNGWSMYAQFSAISLRLTKTVIPSHSLP